MKKRLLVALVVAAGSLVAQKPKSQKELEALQKVQQATTPAAQLQAINDVLTNFADTEFKPMLLQMAVDAANRSGDYTQTTIWGERALQANPKDYNTLYILAAGIVQHTRERDLDRDEKLKKADQYCTDGIEALKTATKPNPQLTDAQWEAAKKDQTSAFYTVMGSAASLRKNYPDAIEKFNTALNTAATPDSVTLARLAKAYNDAGQYDNAIASADKVLSVPNANAQVKQFAQQEKDKATKAKAAPPPAAPKQ